MKNALVPIDGSPAALRALSFALRAMRNPLDAQVHVLNVQAPLVHLWPGKLVSPWTAKTFFARSMPTYRIAMDFPLRVS